MNRSSVLAVVLLLLVPAQRAPAADPAPLANLDAYVTPPTHLQHWHLDTFQAQDWPAPANDTLMVFHLDVDAEVSDVEIPGFGTFERQKSPASGSTSEAGGDR